MEGDDLSGVPIARTSAPASERRVRRTTRAALAATGTGAFVFACSLFFLAESTDRYFAWTIQPPLTAAFLGVNYGAAAALCLLCGRERAWADARAFALPFLVGGTLLTAVTFVHLDRFHMDDVTGWVWLVLYVVFPPGMAVALARQWRLAGTDPRGDDPLPRWMRLVLGVQSAAMLAAGAGLLVAPAELGSAWPWPLTPLTGRVIGVFVLAQGILFAAAAREGDWHFVRIVMIETALLGGLHLVAVARFSGDVQWEEPTAWLFVLVLAADLALGAYGAQRARLGSR